MTKALEHVKELSPLVEEIKAQLWKLTTDEKLEVVREIRRQNRLAQQANGEEVNEE